MRREVWCSGIVVVDTEDEECDLNSAIQTAQNMLGSAGFVCEEADWIMVRENPTVEKTCMPKDGWG